MDHAFPNRLVFECLANRHGLGELRGTAVHALNGFSELVGFNFGHTRHISRNGWRRPRYREATSIARLASFPIYARVKADSGGYRPV